MLNCEFLAFFSVSGKVSFDFMLDQDLSAFCFSNEYVRDSIPSSSWTTPKIFAEGYVWLLDTSFKVPVPEYKVIQG